MTQQAKPTLLAVRAIGALFGVRIWLNVTLFAAGIALLLAVLAGWLIAQSAWWWIFAVLLGVALSVSAVILAVFRILLAHITPKQTKEQKQAVKEFVGKLQFAQEVTQTPKVIILFRVIKSVAAPSSEKYLENIFATRTLKRDFERIVSLF